MNFDIVACFYPPTTQTTTGTPSTTTTTLPSTTTKTSFCLEERGMDQPLTIQPSQVASDSSLDQTTPSGDINPTTSTSGLNFTSKNPQINVTLVHPAALTLIYVPTNRPNEQTNVKQFGVQIAFPNGTVSEEFISEIPSASTTPTTITTTGAPLETTTTPSTSGVVPPSDVSPQVDLPPNSRVPAGTQLIITIKSTQNDANPSGVCIILIQFISR